MELNEINRKEFYKNFPSDHNHIYRLWDNNSSTPFGEKLYEVVEMSLKHEIITYLEYILGPEGIHYFYAAFDSQDDAIKYVVIETESHYSHIDPDELYKAIAEIRAIALLTKYKKLKV